MPSPNFLTCPAVPELPSRASSPSPEERPRRPSRGPTRWIVFGVVIVLLALTVPAVVSLARAGIAARGAEAALRKAETDARSRDFAATRLDLTIAGTELDAFRSALEGSGPWRSVPGIGVQIRALEDAATAGIGTLEGVQDLVGVLDSVASAPSGVGLSSTRRYADLSREEKRAMVQAFADALPSLRLARDKVDLALELWNRVPQDQLISPIRSALQPFITGLPALKRSLDEAVPLMEIGVGFAGYPDPMRALVLLQNSDELRPAGGFIGTIGTMTFDGGDLAEFNFDDVYKIDNPVAATWKEVPPQPLLDRLGVKTWFLRDANWSPDFPTSAERVRDFYIRETELATKTRLSNPPNAVIALEPGFFTALLRLTGPITVDGTTYDADTFYDRLEYAVESDFLKKGIPVAQRKEIMGKIGAALVDRLSTLPVARWPEVLDLLTTSFERKQIMLYAKNPDLLAQIDRRGWSGRAEPTRGDFLWVVDANMAAFKTDGVMDKKISYRLDAKDPANPRATVTLAYTNTNPTFTWRYTRYRSYTRVYVPDGSVLLSSSGAMKDDRYRTGGVAVPGTVDVFKELGKTVFGAFWSIEPGKTGTLSFTYALPPTAVEKIQTGTYELDWPKQAGADLTQLTLDLLFGTNVLSATPAEQKEKWGDARYEYTTDSLADRKFEINLK